MSRRTWDEPTATDGARERGLTVGALVLGLLVSAFFWGLAALIAWVAYR